MRLGFSKKKNLFSLKDPSAKPQPSMPETFTVGMNHAQPTDLNCGAQIAFVHPLKDSELNVSAQKL